MVRALVLGSLVIVVSGCPSRSKEPSAAYEEARSRFNTLYAQKLDQAFLDPEMTEIEALLATVPPESLDAEQARVLQTRIDEGQARMGAAREKHEELLAGVGKGGPSLSNPENTGRPPEVPTEKPVQEPVDAGTAGHPTVGMTSRELMTRFGTCFRPGASVEVAGRGMRETWALKDITLCKQQYAAFTESTIVLEDGKILAIVPNAQITTETRTPDGGVVKP